MATYQMLEEKEKKATKKEKENKDFGSDLEEQAQNLIAKANSLAKSVNITALEGLAGPDTAVIGNNLAISSNMTTSSNSTATALLTNQIASAMTQKTEQTSLKDEILNKILGVMDDKQKTHDSILFGTPVETEGAAGSLVQQTKPKTESEVFLDKLKSYTVQPIYALN